MDVARSSSSPARLRADLVRDPLLFLDESLGVEALPAQQCFGGGDVGQSEDGRERVVQVGRAPLEHLAKLIVGEEWGIAGQRLLPRRLVGGPPPAVDAERGGADISAVPPGATQLQWGGASIDGERRFDAGRGVMQVAPALGPHLGTSLPATVGPGQEHLQRLRQR